MPGSSPRMRGTRAALCGSAAHRRFIPAHAGNTRRVRIRWRRQPVHPRACGEHAAPTAEDLAEGGSSPRMRGTLDDRYEAFQAARFIPAHAGNTLCTWLKTSSVTVHPRACGEHADQIHADHAVCGSSPRMRGTLLGGVVVARHRRFIPAHAGNTMSGALSDPQTPVHPRACGEHEFECHGCGQHIGSSPRMRGTQRRERVFVVGDRFIPAHAGNTMAECAKRMASAVHPRACGEHDEIEAARARNRGSSPRMRGTLGQAIGNASLQRFIPAHAGNTILAVIRCRPPSVHPRACGEHAASVQNSVDGTGSSPRMRGTR